MTWSDCGDTSSKEITVLLYNESRSTWLCWLSFLCYWQYHHKQGLQLYGLFSDTNIKLINDADQWCSPRDQGLGRDKKSCLHQWHRLNIQEFAEFAVTTLTQTNNLAVRCILRVTRFCLLGRWTSTTYLEEKMRLNSTWIWIKNAQCCRWLVAVFWPVAPTRFDKIYCFGAVFRPFGWNRSGDALFTKRDKKTKTGRCVKIKWETI